MSFCFPEPLTQLQLAQGQSRDWLRGREEDKRMSTARWNVVNGLANWVSMHTDAAHTLHTLDDGGVILTFESKISHRELSFTVPEEAGFGWIFVVLENETGEMFCGMLKDWCIIPRLARWINGDTDDIPSDIKPMT